MAMCGLIALVGLVYFGWPKTSSDKISDTNWKTATDMKSGVSFDYPESVLAQYIHTVDWPPKVQWTHEAFTCVEAGTEIAGAEKTEKRMVDDRVYCVTKQSEGAAGSVYITYTYVSAVKNNGTIVVTFTLQAVQCANYDDPQKTACEQEREAFDLDSTIDRIVQSVKIE